MNELTPSDINNCSSELESLDYLREVKSSTCLLLPNTPSPTLVNHPLSDQMNEAPFINLNDDPNILQNIDGAADSSSSADSNSVVQDPVSAQLINNISMLEYQTLSKNGDLILGEVEDCKINGSLNVSNRKLPGFVNWNWPFLRKVLLWVVMSSLVACLAAIIAMVVTIPKSCNPDLPWYQGKVFYEVFPASFKDSNNDGIGDLKGIIKKIGYIEKLGASVIRLNSIFEATHYPDHYYNTTSLINIDKSIGTIKDFQVLVKTLHEHNMSIILDLPVMSMMAPVSAPTLNITYSMPLSNDTLTEYFDSTSAAIAFWARAQNVDGFYLQNLERYVDDINFAATLQFWKRIIGSGKILIASEDTLKKVKQDSMEVLLSRIDLIDVHLDLNSGVEKLKKHIDDVISSPLCAKPHYPWVLWNIGGVGHERVSDKHNNNTLALLVLQYMLPGSINIFYGDEIGLQGLEIQDVEKDFHEHEFIRNIVSMSFSDSQDNQKQGTILMWNSKSPSEPKYQYIEVVSNLTKLKLNTPTIYMKSIYKDGNNLKNTAVRKVEENLVVIERWYPRRNTFVFVGNFGDKSISTDLSSMFYGGMVVGATNNSLLGQMLYFDKVTFESNSGIILKLEK